MGNSNIVWVYKGELNMDGNVCGFGKTGKEHQPEISYQGTFVNEKIHGLRLIVTKDWVHVGECKDLAWFGKTTIFYNNGIIENLFYHERN